MEFLVDINSVNNAPVQFQVSPGEMVYCLSNPNSTSVLNSLVRKEDINVTGSVLGYDLTNKNKNQLRDLRREIAFVDDDLFLSKEHTVMENFELYSAGFTEKAKMLNSFNRHLRHFVIEKSHTVATLNPRDVFFTKLSLCLAKDPRLVVVPRVFTFSSQLIFKQQMRYIYDLIMDGGLTYIAAVSNASLTENYSGRVVTL
jgi:hypothetical protein